MSHVLRNPLIDRWELDHANKGWQCSPSLTEGNYELLDQISGNRQFIVQGGTGTGKTWLVLELARRWACTGPADSRVLFLTYNLALTDFIRDLVRLMRLRGRLPRGEIVVSRHGRRERSILNNVTELAGLPLVEFHHRRPGALAWTPVNKAKGLDALGVVLQDFAPFAEIVEPGFQAAYFMGASRARQLFAAVHSDAFATE